LQFDPIKFHIDDVGPQRPRGVRSDWLYFRAKNSRSTSNQSREETRHEFLFGSSSRAGEEFGEQEKTSVYFSLTKDSPSKLNELNELNEDKGEVEKLADRSSSSSSSSSHSVKSPKLALTTFLLSLFLPKSLLLLL